MPAAGTRTAVRIRETETQALASILHHTGFLAVPTKHSFTTGCKTKIKKMICMFKSLNVSTDANDQFHINGFHLPVSQRIPINPGGQTQSPSLSWHTPPFKHSGQSLSQSEPHLFFGHSRK